MSVTDRCLPIKPTEKLKKKFWKNVDPTYLNNKALCWMWTGIKSEQGYGRFVIEYYKRPPDFRGKSRFGYKSVAAHRFSWVLHNGEDVPKGKMVLHGCGSNASCVNPYHLYIGNHRQNMRDMRMHQKHHIGSKHAKSKLTEEQVLEIRKMYATGKYTHADIAEEFGVYKTNIAFICRGDTWKHVGGPRVSSGPKPLKNISNRKFTPKQIKEIRKKFKAGVSSCELSKHYKTTVNTILWIADRKLYKDVL